MINQKYKIKKLLGKGRSTVYLGEDVEFPGKEIAIKILPKDVDPLEIKFFRDEFFTLHKLNHPNIIKPLNPGIVLEKDEEEISFGSVFFTLEYFNGKSLLNYRRLNDEKILKEVIRQICSVLHYLHLSNYIYYDLKPENILAADVGGAPVIKMIDLGFAQYIFGNNESLIRGTAEYIAPEILKNRKHDFRADLYSLGIILYRIVYERFPFETGNELEIYKSHVEKEFEFRGSDYSSKLIDVIKKLLRKEPEERYGNAVQVLADLDIPVDESLTRDWLPAKVFANRKDSLTILKTYLADNSSGEVFTVRGSEGAGKTALAYEIYAAEDKCIFVENNSSRTGVDFVNSFLNKILFTHFIYPNLSVEVKNKIERIKSDRSGELVNNVKSILNEITEKNKFILILDAFNIYNSFAIEFFKSIIPILQVNKIKVILTENTDKPFITDFIHNLREVNLTPFTEIHLNEFLDKSYSSLFPKDDLRKLIISYADLLPGNLESFIKDIILLKILTFTPEGIKISTDTHAVSLLKSSHEEIYDLRFKSLTKKEKEAAQYLSAFEITVGWKEAASFLKLSHEETLLVFAKLEQKNIILPAQSNSNPIFVSEGLKRFIYSTIKDKKKFHAAVSRRLTEGFPDFNKIELAMQFELAGDYYSSSRVLQEELNNADAISAYAYEKTILQRMVKFPLDKKEIAGIKLNLANICFKLSEYKEALSLLKVLLKEKNIEKERLPLQILEGRSLIGLTEYEEGKNILEPLLEKAKDSRTRQLLLLEIATVEFNLNQYNKSFETCRRIIADNAAPEEMGQAYEMLGLISLYKDSDLDGALENFNKGNKAYEDAGLKFRTAQMQMNIGNIFGMKGENEKAYSFWTKSLEINHSIGNLDQEAKIYVNLGIYYQDNLNFEKSIESFRKALAIFTSLGNKKGLGLTQTNLGEIYTLTCEYQNAAEALTSAVAIFDKLQNKEEKLEALVMLGKMDFVTGDYEGLDSIIKGYHASVDSIDLPEKYKNYYELLDLLKIFAKGEADNLITMSEKLKEFFLEQASRYDYFLCATLSVKSLIRSGDKEKAYEELQSEELLNFCLNNLMFEAERNYMIGAVLENDETLDQKSFMDYYLSAYEMISESYVTELTWKVLYALAKTYGERGNAGKAAEFIKYSESLINFTAGNIKDPRLRNSYLNQPERKEALEKLSLLHEKYL